MNENPGGSRGTTGQGRADGPGRGNHLDRGRFRASPFSARPQTVFGGLRRPNPSDASNSRSSYQSSRPADAHVCGAAGCRDDEQLTEVERADGEVRVLCYSCALRWIRR